MAQVSADERARVGGGTSTYEAHLERKRQALRKALRTEFIRQRYHPEYFSGGERVFDAAIQRFTSMLATRSEFFFPNIRSASAWSVLIAGPIAVTTYLMYKSNLEKETKIRNGEWDYHHPKRRVRWNM